jgi:hypothetical protein
MDKGLHAQPEFAGDLGQLQSEEILDLGTGNQYGDAVGKSDHNRPRDKFHSRAHASGAQNNQDDACHDGAHVESVDAVYGENSRHHDYEGAGGSANLSFRSAQRGDEEARDHRAVDARLWRESRCNGKCHGERQGHQSDGNSGDEVFQKFVKAVVAQADYGLGEPTIVQL